MDLIPIDQCIKGRVYRVHCRNLTIAVYDGNEGFIGIRTKFGDRYLDTEYHWDQGPPYGTVKGTEDLGIDVSESIELADRLGTVDKRNSRPVCFDRPTDEGGKGWMYVDTGETDHEIYAVTVHNKPLFDFLDKINNKEIR